MRKLFCSMFAVAVFLAMPGQVEAQGAAIGPTVAWHDDADFGIGAMADIAVPALAPGIGILADFTYFFPSEDNLNYFEINGNLRWEFPGADMPVVPFALGGLNFSRISNDVSDSSNSSVGLNLGGGLKFNAGTLEPIVGARFEIFQDNVSGDESFVLFGTLPFSVGG